MKKTGINLYLFNAVENEWQYTSGISDKNLRNQRIKGTNQFADSYLFANADRSPLIYISPTRISASFLRYFEKISNVTATVYVPRYRTPSVCRNLIRDEKTLELILKDAGKYGSHVNLFAYASTAELYLLREHIEKKGVTVSLPESPKKEHLWTVSYYGSKCGIREFFSKQNGHMKDAMPEGFICPDIPQAVEKAYSLYTKNGGVVIKTNRGCSGDGVLIFGKNKLPQSLPAFARKLNTLFTQNEFWKNNPIAVETYIASSATTSFPSIEYLINPDGSYRMLYYCLMKVTPEGEFFGMDMSRDIYPIKIVKQMEAIGNQVAREYAANGYRGHFDIDMIFQNGRLYVTESNTRHTGGTDAYKITRELLGPDFFSKHYVISRYLYLGKKKRLLFQEVVKQLKPYLFSKDTGKGIILTSESVFKRHGISYICISENKTTAYDLDQRIASTIRNFSLKT